MNITFDITPPCFGVIEECFFRGEETHPCDRLMDCSVAKVARMKVEGSVFKRCQKCDQFYLYYNRNVSSEKYCSYCVDRIIHREVPYP